MGGKFVAVNESPSGAAGVNAAKENESLHSLYKPSSTRRRQRGLRSSSTLSSSCVIV